MVTARIPAIVKKHVIVSNSIHKKNRVIVPKSAILLNFDKCIKNIITTQKWLSFLKTDSMEYFDFYNICVICRKRTTRRPTKQRISSFAIEQTTLLFMKRARRTTSLEEISTNFLQILALQLAPTRRNNFFKEMIYYSFFY
jgi:hypothetical protein